MFARLTLLAAAGAIASPALADDGRIEALERQLAEQQRRILQLESLLGEQAALLKQLGAAQSATAAAAPAPSPAPPSPPVAVASNEAFARVPGLDVSGDLRVRQEFNVSDSDARDRARSVLRARLRASYEVTPSIAIGAQLATGDPDDPNSTDVTLGNFVDDLDVSLDQAWLRYVSGGLTAYAGKFPQIFARTDMIWDGDVAPQGVGAFYSAGLGRGAKLDARALYFVIDEAPVARDSDMLGGQIVAAAPLSTSFGLSFAGSYFHYRLGSVAGADAGDFRGNLIAGGRYLSDFRLLEGLGTLRWSGLGPRWPIIFTADYVRNLGAAVPADSGFNLELAAGRTLEPGDWRIASNYSEVEVDAVFAAFSHDNLNLATNYRLHGLNVAYVPAPNLLLDLAFYHYRPLDRLYAGVDGPTDWLDRLRLNFMLSF